ncbi:nuclear transport factor 2 family protein [Aquimarina sp. 2201CG5-10]|uniref:nuclear transport factor 2 family protein n=1 Tax=Aquimarina callyspongiae TaxID=3098150 RepID=UPI002AB52F6F|nr:nuclear transport factor 2 family protein [Aquimarina sp. 2201CG5-10]MDY8137103.1 nuclear transport factor 2 family protein [Aquimarina sp. 2201CG5-10]
MRINLSLIILLLFCIVSFAQEKEHSEINSTLEKWHKAASDADFESYFGLMTSNSIFIGTDPTENWNYDAFKAFAKPYFDKGKAWSFTTLERNIFNKKNTNLAWFDELLDTQMGICRGSGILEKTKEGWKIRHYVLSIAIPNENVKEVTSLKSTFDSTLMKKLRKVKNKN